MNQKIIVINEQLRNRAALLCQSIPLDSPHIVTIVEKKESRSDKQHRYYRHLVRTIAGELGSDTESQHYDYKKMFLVDIYCTDDEFYRALYQGIVAKGDDNLVRYFIDKHTSTTKANVQQMNSLTEQVYHHALSLNIKFPTLSMYE